MQPETKVRIKVRKAKRPAAPISVAPPSQSSQPQEEDKSIPPQGFVHINPIAKTYALSSEKIHLPTFDTAKTERICTLEPVTAFPRVLLAKAKGLLHSSPNFGLYLENLLVDYKLWRRVSDDGNSYYRAVGIQYIEHLCCPYIDVKEFDEFLESLNTKEDIFESCQESDYYIPFREQLQYLYELKIKHIAGIESSVALFRQIENYVADKGFDRYIVYLMRLLTINFLEKNYEELGPFVDLSIRELYSEVMGDRNEAEGIVFEALPNVLGVIIDIEYFNEGAYRTMQYKPWKGGRYYRIALWSRPQSVYDCIYTERRGYLDGYNFTNEEYQLIEYSDSNNKHYMVDRLKVDVIQIGSPKQRSL